MKLIAPNIKNDGNSHEKSELNYDKCVSLSSATKFGKTHTENIQCCGLFLLESNKSKIIKWPRRQTENRRLYFLTKMWQSWAQILIINLAKLCWCLSNTRRIRIFARLLVDVNVFMLFDKLKVIKLTTIAMKVFTGLRIGRCAEFLAFYIPFS